ncbi:MAG TPA: PPE domain-containing protein [Trichormus sp.]|jgi:hypothetical protein
MRRKTPTKKCTGSWPALLLTASLLTVGVPDVVHAAPTKDIIVTPYECGDSSVNVGTTCSSKEDILGNNVITVFGEGSGDAGYVVRPNHSVSVRAFSAVTIEIAASAVATYSDIRIRIRGTQSILQSNVPLIAGAAVPPTPRYLDWLNAAAAQAAQAASQASAAAAAYEAGRVSSVHPAEVAANRAQLLSLAYAQDYTQVALRHPVSTFAFEENFQFEKLPIRKQVTTCSGDYRVGLILLPPEVSIDEIRVSANEPHTFGKISFKDSFGLVHEPGILDFKAESCPK